jgi:serine/threonine protein phosphatase PrpC
MTTMMCPACDDTVDADDDYCEACGHALGGTITVAERCAWCQGAVSEGFCASCGMRQRTERDHMEIDLGYAAGVTDRGLRYSRNEDAQAILPVGAAQGPGGPVALAAVVSDGVSASPDPHHASETAVRVGTQCMVRAMQEGRGADAATRAGLAAASQAVAELASSPSHAPACTYVSALVSREPGGGITVGWVGDSRAYWLADPEGPQDSALLTRDDSWSEYMVGSGRLTIEEAQASANAHALIAWLGADAGEVDAHIVHFTPRGPGALVLCSDGLWNYLPDAKEMAAAVPRAAHEPLDSARHCLRVALDGGGHDNITVIVVPLPEVPPGQGDSALGDSAQGGWG